MTVWSHFLTSVSNGCARATRCQIVRNHEKRNWTLVVSFWNSCFRWYRFNPMTNLLWNFYVNSISLKIFHRWYSIHLCSTAIVRRRWRKRRELLFKLCKLLESCTYHRVCTEKTLFGFCFFVAVLQVIGCWVHIVFVCARIFEHVVFFSWHSIFRSLSTSVSVITSFSRIVWL